MTVSWLVDTKQLQKLPSATQSTKAASLTSLDAEAELRVETLMLFRFKGYKSYTLIPKGYMTYTYIHLYVCI